MDLTERERLVLAALVELYVHDAGPVSSGHIQEAIGLGVSSATIRNVLHRLEDMGLLHQPHTSAGRVPTRDGYRVYVETFCRPARLPGTWMRRIHEALQPATAHQPVQEVLARVSQLLALLSSNVGFGVALEDPPSARVQRIEVVQLEHQRLLVLVTLDDGMVRTCLVPLECRYSPFTLELAEHMLNEIVAGCTLNEARQRLELAVEARTGEAGELARRVAREKNRLFEPRPTATVRLEGATQIIGQPEFKDPENLRLLVKVLDHPESLELLLREPGPRRATITIGVAAGDEELPFSVVSAGMHLAGWEGHVGILGPMRMRYALGLALVQSVVEILGKLEDQRRSGDGGQRERA